MARPRTDIQPRILHAARARFLAQGVEGASLRDIAKDAKTSIGMVYYYFATKDDLFQAVVEEIYAGLLHDMAACLAAKPEGECTQARLERASARVGKASAEELQVVRLIVHEALLGSDRFRRLFERFQRGHLALIAGVLGDGLRQGEVVPDVPLPVLLVATLGMLALPQVVRRVAGDQGVFVILPDADAFARTLSGLLFSGIGATQALPAKVRPPSRKKASRAR